MRCFRKSHTHTHTPTHTQNNSISGVESQTDVLRKANASTLCKIINEESNGISKITHDYNTATFAFTWITIK